MVGRWGLMTPARAIWQKFPFSCAEVDHSIPGGLISRKPLLLSPVRFAPSGQPAPLCNQTSELNKRAFPMDEIVTVNQQDLRRLLKVGPQRLRELRKSEGFPAPLSLGGGHPKWRL